MNQTLNSEELKMATWKSVDPSIVPNNAEMELLLSNGMVVSGMWSSSQGKWMRRLEGRTNGGYTVYMPLPTGVSLTLCR